MNEKGNTVTKRFICIRNYEFDGRNHFVEGKTYTGSVFSNARTVKIKGEYGLSIYFINKIGIVPKSYFELLDE